MTGGGEDTWLAVVLAYWRGQKREKNMVLRRLGEMGIRVNRAFGSLGGHRTRGKPCFWKPWGPQDTWLTVLLSALRPDDKWQPMLLEAFGATGHVVNRAFLSLAGYTTRGKPCFWKPWWPQDKW